MVCALAVFSPVCYGQDVMLAAQKGKTHPPVTHKVSASRELKGKIDTVTVADPSKGIRHEISVVDESGKRYTFMVKPTTTIYGPDWKAISLDKLVKDQQVRVQYTANREGFLTALSIKPAAEKEK